MATEGAWKSKPKKRVFGYCCAITTVDHVTGKRTGDEPLATLKTYRFDRQLHGVVFGRNAYAVAGAGGTLTRAAPVSIIAA